MRFEKTSRAGCIISCDHPGIPTDNRNIVAKIYDHYQNQIGFGLKIHIKKRIPIGGGLGGSSANAAGLLCYLNQAAGWHWTNTKLGRQAAKFGADIPFMLKGGTALVRGIGDKMTPLPQGDYRYFLLINSGLAISSKLAYQWLDQSRQEIIKPTRTPTAMLKTQVGPNDFWPVLKQKYPQYQELESKLTHLGSPPLYLSGSGSTVFLAFDQAQAAKDWQAKLRATIPKIKTTLACAIKTGCRTI